MNPGAQAPSRPQTGATNASAALRDTRHRTIRPMAVSAEIRRNATLVAVAGGVYLLAQVVLSGFARPLAPEEVNVLRGGAGASLWLVRLVMMLLTTGALVLAFRAWVRPAARVAWAAAGTFAISWGPVFFGAEVRPHVLAALACVAAGGCAMRWLVERDRAALIGLTVTVAAAVVLRPLAAVGLVTTLVIVFAVGARRQAGPALAAVALGGAIGYPLGMVGVLARFAGRVVAAPLRPPRIAAGLQQFLHALQSPFVPTTSKGTSFYVALAVVGALTVVMAVVQLRWAHRRNAALIGLSLALGLFVPAVAVNRITAAELLPAYAALCIPLGAGVLAAWDATRRAGSWPVTALFFAALGAFAIWQVALAAQHGATAAGM